MYQNHSILLHCGTRLFHFLRIFSTAVSSEAWAKLRDLASVAARGWLLLSGSVVHASLETAVGVASEKRSRFDTI